MALLYISLFISISISVDIFICVYIYKIGFIIYYIIIYNIYLIYVSFIYIHRHIYVFTHQIVKMTSAWCQTLHFHPTKGWPEILHWTQATLSHMCLLSTAGQPGPCWPESRESSACRKHWMSGKKKISPTFPPPDTLCCPMFLLVIP